MGACNAQDGPHVARHTHLMDTENGGSLGADRLLDASGIDVEGGRVDIHEHGYRTAMPDRVRRRNEGVTGRDHLAPRSYADGHEREVERRRAVRYSAGQRCADRGGKLLFEGGDLWAL